MGILSMIAAGGLFALLIVATLYFLPTIVAFARGQHNRMAILVLNLLAGWTVIGWVVAMVWAFMKPPAAPAPPDQAA